MADHSLQNRTILVVEDEYYLATDLEEELSEAGAVVLGPVPSVKDAVALIDQTPCLDAAVLDINLGGETAFSVADKLKVKDVPFLFVTGYYEQGVPASYGNVPRLEKPTEPRAIVKILAQIIR